MMVGRSVDDLYPRSQRKQGEAVLQISDLAGQTKPVDASLTLHRGEIVGIAGLVGAGRTEFLRAIFGLAPVKRGEDAARRVCRPGVACAAVGRGDGAAQ